MSDQIRVDIDRLRDHIDIVRNERKLAREVTDAIRAARQLDDLNFYSQYSRICSKSEQLENHFSSMVDTLEIICDLFIDLGNDIDQILKDGLHESKQ